MRIQDKVPLPQALQEIDHFPGSTSASSTSDGSTLLGDLPAFLPADVSLGDEIGRGNFGVVNLAKCVELLSQSCACLLASDVSVRFLVSSASHARGHTGGQWAAPASTSWSSASSSPPTKASPTKSAFGNPNPCLSWP